MRLVDRVAVVTGGAGGIGRFICRTLANEGAKVAVLDIDPAGAKKVADEILGTGLKASSFACDITQWEDVIKVIDQVLNQFGKIDVLVNSAGVWESIPFAQTSPQAWERQIKINYYGTLHCTRAVLDTMIEQRYGRLINIISDAGRRGVPGFAIYGSTKAAINMFTKGLCCEVGTYGVTVNAVSPGMVEAENSMTDIQRIGRDTLLSQTPIGRLCLPQDIANAVLFLASDEASFITGETFSVNGGRSTF